MITARVFGGEHQEVDTMEEAAAAAVAGVVRAVGTGLLECGQFALELAAAVAGKDRKSPSGGPDDVSTAD
ncbi:hypothetical protein [Streptomyces beihaiensis]|uniref:Uncharacterized protein n=1 Tax=Streptomyces beihaiensis TaxID=2984495 RepID=A0ABT3TRQ0_9ACTN|nr:hypothetical protein [Streptomyces beihaiensis]MCX3059719.1 hypothetical protein [Streptomyces beihaiensis]